MQRSTALAGLVAIAASTVVTPQDEGERDAEAVLDELIERASSIESYRVVYETSGEEKATLTVAFVWPNKAHVELAAEKTSFRLTLVDGVLFGESDEGRIHMDFGPAVEATERVREAARDVFPDAFPEDESPIGAQVSLFVLTHGHGHDTDSEGTFINLAWVDNLRSPLPWLVEMKRHAEYELENGSIHCRPNGSEDVWIDLESGFPRRMELRGDETTRILELVELEIDSDLPEALFDPSGSGEEPLEEGEVRRVAATLAGRQKDSVYAFLCRHFDAEPEAWDEDDVRSVFDAVHQVLLEIHYAPWVEGMKGAIEEFGERLSVASSERPSDEIDKGVEHFQKQLEERISRIVLRDLERLAEVEPRLAEGTPTEYLEEMHALEVEGAEAAYQRVLADPLLELLDKVVEENRQDTP